MPITFRDEGVAPAIVPLTFRDEGVAPTIVPMTAIDRDEASFLQELAYPEAGECLNSRRMMAGFAGSKVSVKDCTAALNENLKHRDIRLKY